MKKILLVLVSLFAAAELAWAAVTPIADTPFNSNFSVKSAGSSGSAGSAGTSDDEDTSHTSTYEGANLPACGPVTISAEGGEAAAKNLCATALGVDTDKVSYTLCDDGSKGTCTYLETCTGGIGTGEAVSGSDSVSISRSISAIAQKYTNVDNNLGVEAGRCSSNDTPYLYFQCDSSYTETSRPACADGKTALSCSLNGALLWKCDYAACTSEQLNKTLGDDTPATSALLAGTKVAGSCYENMNNGTRKLRTIYVCDEEVYPYTEASCKTAKGTDYAVAALNGACIWNGAYRNGQATLIDEAQGRYEYCQLKCPSRVTEGTDSCEVAGDVLNTCVLEGSVISDNRLVQYCGCPQTADGEDAYVSRSDCPVGYVAGGRTCNSARTLDVKYQLCLPECAGDKTVRGSYHLCLTELEETNQALSRISTPISPLTAEATPLAADNESGDDYNRYVIGRECCRQKDGSKYDCIDEPFKVNADGTCQEDASYYCADSFMLKNKCGNDTQMCCQFKSSGAVINSSCLGLGTFITDEATGLCSEGTPLSYTYDYCADDNKKKVSDCSAVATQCCSFKGNDTSSEDAECSSDFVLLNEAGACSKIVDNIVDSSLCFTEEFAEKASYSCSCPTDLDYTEGACPAGQTAVSTCNYDGIVKNICAAPCSQEDIAAGSVKSNIDECKVNNFDTPNAVLCVMPDQSLRYRCSCPENYTVCPGNLGGGQACTFDGGEKYAACMLNRSAIQCDENMVLVDSMAECQTVGGTATTATQCYMADEPTTIKYMCECPNTFSVCGEGEAGGGDSCKVQEQGKTYYETCAKNCRINTAARPVVDTADGCPKVGEDAATTTVCVTNGQVRYECGCPSTYTAVPSDTAVGVGEVCTYDGDAKFKSYEEGCPADRPLFYTEDACSFDGVKGINVKTCYANGQALEENVRYYCDCPASYLTDSQCAAANKEGTGFMCQLEGETYAKTKYQYCYPKCSLLPSSGASNGTIMEDDISDNRACQWELGQGAVYEQCSDNHVIRNKCYCPSAYDSRLTCDSEDNLSPVVDAEHPACSVDGVTYYQACKARKCDEGAVLATSEGACRTLLGTAATAIACTKDNETTSYYECSCDTSVYSEVCRYPQVEPSGEKYCYAGKYDASSNPSPDKQYKTGMCKVGSFEKCYQDGDNTNGYQVIVTKSESECRQKLGDGAEARMCEDRNDPDIRRFNCYFNPGEYKWTDDNCPVRHILGGGSIVINGKRYYKECKCHSAYKYHRYNCAGLLNGGGCEQEVTSENNDGTIPGGITSLKFFAYCECSEDYNQVCDGERYVGVGEPCNGKYQSCECKKDELPENWVDNYYGCPGGAKPTGVTKPNGCGGKYYQCEASQCTWQHTEQCKGDFQIGVDPCQDNQGEIYAYKSCKCPDGWSKCSSNQVGEGKPCSLNGDNYYESCKAQSECIKGEYLTCNDPLQVGVNPCTKNDKIYFESCTCASGYNKVCGDGETGVGSACVVDGVSYYQSCTKPAAACSDQHQKACAANQEKYDPCLGEDNQMMYKCRCPANYTSCSSTSPAENATTCVDNERGTVYSACTGENTCTEDEESIYKTCTKQQVGMGRSCTSSDGTTKYAECQDTKDCKANGYKYVCSGYQADALGEDFCIDENGSKLFKECKCPANYLQCPAKNVKGTPCTPLLATGESGETVYSKCECGSQYSETCDGNGQSPGSEDDACQTTNADGDTVTYYKSCVCGDEYSKTCAETGAIPTDKSEVCTEIKYVGNQKVQTQKYKSCGCGEAYKYKCDGTDDGDDANNAAKYTLSNGCTTTVDGESVTRYKACLCGSSYTVTCTSNIQPGADSCTSINADGSKSTKYVAGSCPEPEPEPCVPADCSSYSIASLSAIVGQCGHPKNYSTCSPGCDQPTKYACLYPKADIESTWKYTRENCPEPNELSDGKTFEFAGGATETRYKVCRCPTAYNKTDATCKNINTSEVAGASGNIVCSERSKPVSGSDPTFTPASCGSILGLDESDVCVDKETNVTYGKYCKCDGPSYSSSSCPNTTALVCKTSTSTNWQYIKCL